MSKRDSTQRELTGQVMSRQRMETLHYLLTGRPKYDSDLADHLRFARNVAKYTSPQIQNEISSLCEREIRHNIVSPVPQYWSILAAKTQDCSRPTCE